MNHFQYTDEDGDLLTIGTAIGLPFVAIRTDPNGCFIPLDRVEEVIASIRETAARAINGGAS